MIVSEILSPEAILTSINASSKKGFCKKYQ